MSALGRRRPARRAGSAAWCMASFALLACGGTTGSALVSFSAVASGPADATGAALAFSTGTGAEVTLTSAQLHLGAVYLNESVPASGAAAGPCISPGIHVGEVFGPMDVDLLSASPTPFPVLGEGTETPATTAEVWLTGGDVNQVADATVILAVTGSAVQDNQLYPFSARLTIGGNRQLSVTNSALPSANPICHQRIVTPILVDLTPTDGGSLVLEIDPRAMFNSVDFSTAVQRSEDPLAYEIPDTSAGAGGSLFKGMVANSGVYTFRWQPEEP